MEEIIKLIEEAIEESNNSQEITNLKESKKKVKELEKLLSDFGKKLNRQPYTDVIATQERILENLKNNIKKIIQRKRNEEKEIEKQPKKFLKNKK